MALNPAPNGLGWDNIDVLVTFTETGDHGPSGVNTCTVAVPMSTETAADGETVGGTCKDNAGNVSAATVVTVKLDKTGPTMSDTVSVAGTAGANGWYTPDVTVDFTATDALSALDKAINSVTSSGEGHAVTASSPQFTDRAGNATTADDEITTSFEVDKTAPANLAFVGGPESSSTACFGPRCSAPTRCSPGRPQVSTPRSTCAMCSTP